MLLHSTFPGDTRSPFLMYFLDSSLITIPMGLINTAATLLYYYFTKKVNYFTSTAFDKIRKSYRSHQGFACFLRLSRKMRNALYYLTVYRDNMANIPFHSILSGKIILMSTKSNSASGAENSIYFFLRLAALPLWIC